jgi:hypothetical protein
MADPRTRTDQALWFLLLSRWAEVDGAGMVAYAKDHQWLQPKAWYAWGAAHPAAAIEAGRTLNLKRAID